MVNNLDKINKTINYHSPQIIEHKLTTTSEVVLSKAQKHGEVKLDNAIPNPLLIIGSQTGIHI